MREMELRVDRYGLNFWMDPGVALERLKSTGHIYGVVAEVDEQPVKAVDLLESFIYHYDLEKVAEKIEREQSGYIGSDLVIFEVLLSIVETEYWNRKLAEEDFERELSDCGHNARRHSGGHDRT